MKKPSKALLAQWDKKLAKAGFVDAEDRGNGLLKRWDSAYYQTRYTPMEFQAKERYYELARQWLEEGYFETKLHQQIWALHTEGLSYREIGKKIGKKKDAIGAIVLQCKKEAGFKDD